MKRITIALDDKIHASLSDYAKARSRHDFSPSNLSSAVRKLLAEKLEELGYYPLESNNKQTSSMISLISPEEKSLVVEQKINVKEKAHLDATAVHQVEEIKGHSSNLKLYPDLLSIKGTKITRKDPNYVSCKSSLSWTVMKEYLNSLEALGFVGESTTSASGEEKRIYHLSETAFGILKQFLQFEKIVLKEQ